MAETKNVFLGAKMNKDVDLRLMSNREYIEARNASVTDSSGGDSGVLENVFGNIELTDFGLIDVNLKIIGFHVDTTNDRLFAFLTNYTDSSATGLTNPAPAASGHYIAVYNTISNEYTVLVGGSFLNFSDTHEVLGIDLIENLLFFTDNRNQPRKINVNLASANPYGSANPYYTSEDHISVAKYYPYLSPDLTTLNGDGTLFLGSVLNIQTNWPFTKSVGSSALFEVGTGGVTTSGSGSAGLEFNLTSISTGSAGALMDNFILSSATITTASATGGYAVGDTITIPNATLVLAFWPIGLYGGGDAVFVVSRANMARTPSMWDVVSEKLPDGETSNPYYDATFTGNEQFLSDKFVRFSYRFKFEDNEYSLIAPFSQAAFIPKQDGYFLEDSIPTSILDNDANSDELNALKSTIINFFENKVNKIDISIPMPDGVTLGDATTNLYNKYKVTDIDVLFKESDGITIRVIDTITFDELQTAAGTDYVYSYNSSKPIKSLPSKETIRVNDKVPLRAKAQAVAGNRVMYGNLTLRGASLDSLNYIATADGKVGYGTNGSTSQREYPNHTLKQNRNYQVGVVLSDKFGRQSDVILSPNSTVFHPYKSSVMSLEYLGDSLQVQFNAPIPSKSSNIGYVGLYDETINPLGWYSYKFVVKQQEQSYYNVYLPTILNGYPQDIFSGTDITVGPGALTGSITINQNDFTDGTYTGVVEVSNGYTTNGNGLGLKINVSVVGNTAVSVSVLSSMGLIKIGTGTLTSSISTNPTNKSPIVSYGVIQSETSGIGTGLVTTITTDGGIDVTGLSTASNVLLFCATSLAITASDATYPSLSLVGGSGTGAVISVTVASNIITAISVTSQGTGYKVGDVLNLPAGYPNNRLILQSFALTNNNVGTATVTVVTVTGTGSGYIAGDTVTFAGSSFGGGNSGDLIIRLKESDFNNTYTGGFAVGDEITVTGSGGVLGGTSGNLKITLQASDFNTYKTSTDQAHITLFSDNINKVPRDLQEVGPQDIQFSSSVRMFGRVWNQTFLTLSGRTNRQYYPSNIADRVILIGDRNEIGLDKTESGVKYYSSPFYSIPTDGIGDQLGDGSALMGSNPYIGRVSTLNTIGALGGGDLTEDPPYETVTNLMVRLNVYETAPTVSNLDIFWESSTSDLISNLNTSVEQNFSALPVKLNNFEWSLSENDTPTTEISRFNLATASGIVINNSNTTAELIEVRNGNGGIVTNKFTLVKDGATNEFYITTSSGTYFTYTQFSPIKDNYTFTIKAGNNGVAVVNPQSSLISTGYGNYLVNVAPMASILSAGSNPLPEIKPPSTWSTFVVLNGVNGSAQVSNKKTGLVWEVTKIEFLWVGNGISAWTEYQTAATDMFRIVKGVGQSVAETLQYNNQLICLDVNATNTTALYTYQNRTTTSVRVTLKLTDASGTGLNDTLTYDMPPITLNRID